MPETMSRSQPGPDTAQSQIAEEIRRIRFDSRHSLTRDIVPHDMRRDISSMQCRSFSSGQSGVLSQYIGDTITGQFVASDVAEDDVAGTRLANGGQAAKFLRGFAPQRAEPIFAVFTMQAYLLGVPKA
jgi:hypothetical protein